MLARVFSLIAASSVFLAVAAMPTPQGGSQVDQCNGGTVQCCNQYHEAETESEDVKGMLAALLGINLEGVTGIIGVNCSPVTAVGAGGNSCSTQQVCCQGNYYNSFIAVGCSPINIAA